MAKRKWEIFNNQKNKRWYIQIPAGLELDAYPSIADLRSAAAEKSINQYTMLSDVLLQKNFDKAIEAVGEEFSFPIVLDPSFDVRLLIAPDKTKAHLYIRKAADAANPIDTKLISNLLNNSHLKGMDAAKLNTLINDFRKSPAMELNDLLIAEGTSPGRGPNRELLPQFDWMEENESKELCGKLSSYFRQSPLSETGAASAMCERAKFGRVIKGTIVYELSPAQPGPAGIDVYGKEIPGLPGNDPFFQIQENITISPAGLKAEQSGILIASEAEGVLRLRIIEYADAIATPVIETGNMTASLILEGEKGPGTPLSVEMCLSALKNKGIQGEINIKLIEKTIREVQNTKTNAEIAVLHGQKPVPPGASRISWSVLFPHDTKAVNITAGDAILSIEKFPSGADGFDVFGAQLKAATGKIEPIPAHDSTITEETSREIQILVAGMSGELIFADNNLSISDTKIMTANIDDTTGDITFPGNLVLNGNISNGRSLKAKGILTVNGIAEAALVSANDSVTINGGIQGKGKGTVWAKQTINLTFAENATILAGKDISIDKYCFQSTVKTNGRLLVSGNPGILLGGNIRASRGVEVFELGSEKTIRTSISFGQNYLVSDQIEVSEKEVKNIEETLKIIDAEMKKTLPSDSRIHELRSKKLEFLKKNEKLTVRIFTLKEQFESHVVSHIRVDNTVYPGVILESHGRYYEVRERKCHVIFNFDLKTGQIICSPIEN
jgi:uncharacterized protein (DUF342 family)